MPKLIHYLTTHYDFRYNVLTEQTEFARKGGSTFTTVEQRHINGLTIGAMIHGVPCWDKDVKRYIQSDLVPSYHPFQRYMDTLPAWDGVDRVTPLAQRVSGDDLWVNGFHTWMLGMAAQWMRASRGESATNQRANSVMPLLISTQQGWGKSTFCRMLMPNALKGHFAENYDLNAQNAATLKLASCGLINLDEFDRIPATKMPLLKNLLQMERPNLRKAYHHTDELLSRIASFIGTSNRRDLLTDRTGSRRFLCVELTAPIDCETPIDHAQLYAQLKAELERGERYWLTNQEEAAIQLRNRSYMRDMVEEELFHRCFRMAESADEAGAQFMSTSAIFEEMRRQHPAAMRGITLLSLSHKLSALGTRVRTRNNNGYYVCPCTEGQEA